MLAFKWWQFAGEVILWAVWRYSRCGISYRELARKPIGLHRFGIRIGGEF
jgi:transposase-like protein